MNPKLRWTLLVAGAAALLVIAGLAVRLDPSSNGGGALGGLFGGSRDETSAGAPADGPAEPETPEGTVITREDGSELVGTPVKQLEQLPEGTIVFFDSAKITADATYMVVFSPYGWAPDGQGPDQLVVRIISAEPDGPAAKAIDINDRSLCCVVDAAARAAVVTMDRYRGVVRLEQRGSDLVPMLTDVRPYEQ